MFPPSLANSGTTDTAPANGSASGPRRRAIPVRAAVSVSAGLLLLLSMWAPIPTPTVPAESSASAALAALVFAAIDVTTVLVAVAALAVVALLRKLPYGIGVVIACTVGAVFTTALVRAIAGSSIPPTDLPSGQVAAVASLLGAASMVASTGLRPMVLGLGTVSTFAAGLSALVVGSSSTTGVVGAASIAIAWWSVCSIVMLHSPAAAARDAGNPLDTAAMAAQRTMGRSR